MAILLMADTLVVMWRGMQVAINEIPEKLVQEAMVRGIPTIYFDRIRLVGKVFAYLTIFIGWILLAHMTVWITQSILS